MPIIYVKINLEQKCGVIMEETKLNLRSIARIQAMKILYISDFNGVSVEIGLAMAEKGLLDNDALNNQKEISEDAKHLLKFTDDNLEKIDEIISKTLVNYTINRLNLVDKSIIRIATAELLEGKLDKRIIINEALEITKLYTDQGDHKAVAFNNRLLDNISKNIK